MEFKDYYATLGVARNATQDEVKRAYRKLARKFHPDVSKEPNAEARFKEVAEAHEALIDPERRAAYDELAQRLASGQPFEPPPGWDTGHEFSGRGAEGAQHRPPAEDFSDFFGALFGRAHARGTRQAGARDAAWSAMPMPGNVHHAQVQIDLLDAYRGAQHTITLRMPAVGPAGTGPLQERRLEIHIPRGVRPGQQLRLAGQGAAGQGGAAAGDLFLEVQFRPHPVWRVDGRDVHFNLPVTPWEAALGASISAPTPEGPVQLSIPPGSAQGRKLRLKGRGLPGKEAGDLYALLLVALPQAGTDAEKEAYEALGRAFLAFEPRSALGA